MKIVIIGGTGHVGTYLVPRLVNDGHEVISISRQQRQPYQPNEAWKSVEQISIDRDEEEKNNNFGTRILEFNADVVIDMICFTLDSARQLVESLDGKVKHFLHCGTIWTHGHSIAVPTVESQAKAPFGEYGIQKAAIESYLLGQYKNHGFPVTILHPGHIVGPGWAPLNPAGNFNTEVFKKLSKGEELTLPNFGMETLHHVHADDVAQSFHKAINNFDEAVGENFHVVSAQAITLRGYAENISAWFGKAANLKFLPWGEWKKTMSKEDANFTLEHIMHSPNCSIERARMKVGFAPKYSSLEAVEESVSWLMENKQI